MNEIIIGLLIGILLLQFIAYFMNQMALRALNQKQQSTIYGVSHLWGSIIELREELKSKDIQEIVEESEIEDSEEGLTNG
jgi:hypothetical protein